MANTHGKRIRRNSSVRGPTSRRGSCGALLGKGKRSPAAKRRVDTATPQKHRRRSTGFITSIVSSCASTSADEGQDKAAEATEGKSRYIRFHVDLGCLPKPLKNSFHDSSAAVDTVCDALPERRGLILQLVHLLGQDPLPNSLFVYGHSASGKTDVTRRLLQALTLSTAWIDGRECYAADVVYQLALQRLYVAFGCDTVPTSRCDDADEFVRQVKALTPPNPRSVVLVIDQAEHLCRFAAPGPLPVLLALNELTDKPITTVMISSLPWEDTKPSFHLSTPLQIYFPPYNQAELVSILSRNRSDAHEHELYRAFVRLFCSTMKSLCTNLKDLRCLVKEIFPKFVEPVKAGEIGVQDIHILWQRVQPALRQALRHYFRPCRTDVGQGAALGGEFGRFSSGKPLELARHSKFLLIAAFLASYNPSSADSQLFTKTGVRLSKRQRHAAKFKVKEEENRLTEGPLSFPLHRLMAIFHSICEECLAPSAHLFSQVSSLVSLRLLSLESDTDLLDDPHYMCTASHDCVQAVARTVDFDMSVYMSMS